MIDCRVDNNLMAFCICHKCCCLLVHCLVLREEFCVCIALFTLVLVWGVLRLNFVCALVLRLFCTPF